MGRTALSLGFLMERLLQRACGFDQFVELLAASLADHLIAFQRHQDMGAAEDAPDRFDHLGIQGGHLAVGGVHRGVADILRGRDSLLARGSFDAFSLGIREADRLRFARVRTFFLILVAGFSPVFARFGHGFSPWRAPECAIGDGLRGARRWLRTSIEPSAANANEHAPRKVLEFGRMAISIHI